MEDVVSFNELYDLYGDLLTVKQKEYFEEYYFNNFSLSEMAENYDVSRNAIHKQLKIVIEKLEDYENKMQLYKKMKKLDEFLVNINDENIKKTLEDIFY